MPGTMQHSRSVLRRLSQLCTCSTQMRALCTGLLKQNHSEQHSAETCSFTLPQPEMDLNFFCDPKNQALISENIRRRRGTGDLDNLAKLFAELKNCDKGSSSQEASDVRRLLNEEIAKFPNLTHPAPVSYKENKLLEVCGAKRDFDFPPAEFHKLALKLSLLRTAHLGKLTGPNSYYLTGALARLEQALIRYSVDYLLKRNFTLVSVPDLLCPSLIEGCGMPTKGKRSQVYFLDPTHGSVCLSGTAEMALAGLFCNKTLTTSLPERVAAVSRCYRAEVTKTAEERGIFRVHQFTKVEMFAVTENQDDSSASNAMLDEFVSIQRDLFAQLGLHFNVLDMAPNELGNPAYRKIDIEAWMPGRKAYGEISSASNCTDYQCRRLGIKYKTSAGKVKHAHTVNGTACAIPRMLIALMETHQQADGSIVVPSKLQPYMNDLKEITYTKEAVVKWISLKSKLK